MEEKNMIQAAQTIYIEYLLLLTVIISICLFFLSLIISRIRDRIHAKRELLTPFKITENILPLEIPTETPEITIEEEETPTTCPWLKKEETIFCDLAKISISETFAKDFCEKQEKWITCEYMPKKCPTCNTEIPPGAKFCTKCGAQIIKQE